MSQKGGEVQAYTWVGGSHATNAKRKAAPHVKLGNARARLASWDDSQYESDLDDVLMGDDAEPHPVDVAAMYSALGVIKSEASNMLTLSGSIRYGTAPPVNNLVAKTSKPHL